MSDRLAHLGVSLPVAGILGPAIHSNRPNPARVGNGFQTRALEDIAVLAQLGITDIRLGFDWSRLQPRPGSLDGSWAEWYGDIITTAHHHGVRLWATLLERTIPQWFDDEGGFNDAKTAGRFWPRFVETMAETFGDQLDGWFPIDDPLGFVDQNAHDDGRQHGELLHTMVEAWRDAWRILRGGPPVAGSFTIRHITPLNESQDAADEARRRDHLVWRTFLRGLRDGTVVIPGRADRELADLAGAIDIVGIRIRTDLGSDRVLDDDTLRRWNERAQMFIHRVANEGPNLPMAIIYQPARPSWSETDRDGEVMTETFGRAFQACINDGLPLTHTFFEPGIATVNDKRFESFVDWDRQITLSGTAWTTLTNASS
jgi:beta-glucosidase